MTNENDQQCDTPTFSIAIYKDGSVVANNGTKKVRINDLFEEEAEDRVCEVPPMNVMAIPKDVVISPSKKTPNMYCFHPAQEAF